MFHLRTTVDIPDLLYRKLKSRAAAEGSSVKLLILRGVEKELDSGAGKGGRISLPIVQSKQPGSLNLTNEQIYEAIPFP